MIVEQLCEIYFKHEDWHKNKMSEAECFNYHHRLIEKGNIIYYQNDGMVWGYVEFWRINFEQLGRLVCSEPVFGSEEDVQSGDIAYIHNVWIRADKRCGYVYRLLRLKFFQKNRDAKYFGGRRIKRNNPIVIYKKNDLIINNILKNDIFMEEVYGR